MDGEMVHARAGGVMWAEKRMMLVRAELGGKSGELRLLRKESLFCSLYISKSIWSMFSEAVSHNSAPRK